MGTHSDTRRCEDVDQYAARETAQHAVGETLRPVRRADDDNFARLVGRPGRQAVQFLCL